MSHFVECPLCFQNFSDDFIQTHAQKCKGKDNSQTDEAAMPASKKAKTMTSTNSRSFGFFSPKSTKSTPKIHSGQMKGNNADDRKRIDLKGPKKEIKKFSTSTIPLAELSRPANVHEFIGQKQIFSENSVLSNLLQNNVIPSMIFWGPPGCGKTSLANVIATRAKSSVECPMRFVKLSATSAHKSDVQAAVSTAKNDWKMFKRRTILFIDEIHRFNKLQQDTFLPHVEDGTIILIGATTENPSFSLNSAILSRCRVIVMEKLKSNEVKDILMRSLSKFEPGIKVVKSDMAQYQEAEQTCSSLHHAEANNNVIIDDEIKCSPDCEIVEENKCEITPSNISITEEAVFALANLCDGDARIALTGLQMSIQSAKSVVKNEPASKYCVDLQTIKKCFQRSHVLYDRKGDQHFDIISAFHKSIRGCDDNAALYWLTRMMEGGEDPRYIARRMIRIASEDIGLADSNALNVAVSAHQGCDFVGKPECDVILAQCAVYLARAPKSVEVYMAMRKAKECIKNHEGPLPGVPIHLRNAPTQLMKNLGYGKDYSYAPSDDQTYMPDSMLHCNFFDDA